MNPAFKPAKQAPRAFLLAGLALLGILAGGRPSLAEEAPSASNASARARLASPPVPLPDFVLVNQEGKSGRLSELAPGTRLVYFGFTHCPSVCPPALQKLRQVQKALHDEKTPLTGVFISVDGARDSPAVLKEFLASFGPGFVGLTGDANAVRDIAAKFSAVFFKGMPTDRSGGYNMEHTSQVYLVDPAGMLRATFYDAPVEEMAAMTRDVLREAGR